MLLSKVVTTRPNPMHNIRINFRKIYSICKALFAQMCDQLNLKRNYAKSYQGLVTRLTSKLSSMAILHWINYLKGGA
jgi:hypothetical protein